MCLLDTMISCQPYHRFCAADGTALGTLKGEDRSGSGCHEYCRDPMKGYTGISYPGATAALLGASYIDPQLMLRNDVVSCFCQDTPQGEHRPIRG